MIDVSSAEGWLATALRCMHLVQMVVQGRWLHDCTLLTLPCVDQGLLSLFRINGRSLECLPELLDAVRGDRKILNKMLGDALSPGEITEVEKYLSMSLRASFSGYTLEEARLQTSELMRLLEAGMVHYWLWDILSRCDFQIFPAVSVALAATNISSHHG